MIPKKTIELVKERVDIVKLAEEELDIQLRRMGTVYKALCPMPSHDEKTASFTIDPEKQSYVCYGCGANGDAIELVKEIQGNLTFVESIKFLANIVDVPIIEDATESKTPKVDTSVLIDIMKAASEYYAEQKNKAVTDFIEERNLDESYLREKWQVGYSQPNHLLTHLRSLNFRDKDIVATGLFKQNDQRPGQLYEMFKGRMMWTIYDNLNRPVGFGARKLFDKDPIDGKFINTPTTAIYKKSDILFGLNQAKQNIRQKRIAILSEGYTDVVSFHLSDLPYAVAPCGTSVTDRHIKRLVRLLGENGELVVAMDGDSAGIKSAAKILHLASSYPISISSLIFPDDMDPDKYRITHQTEGLNKYFQTRKPLVETLLEHAIAQHDLSHPEGINQAANDAGEILSNVHNSVLRSQYDKWVAYKLNVSRQSIASLYQEKKIDNANIIYNQSLEYDVLRFAYQKPSLFKIYQEAFYRKTGLFSDPKIKSALDEILWLDSDVEDGQWKENLLEVVPENMHLEIKRGLSTAVVTSDQMAEKYLEQLINRLETDHEKMKTDYLYRQQVFKDSPTASAILENLTALKERETTE